MVSIDRDFPLEPLRALCKKHRVRELSIFGSSSRGDDGPESDVDLLVEFEPLAHVGFPAFARLQDDLAAALNRPVDLVSKAGLKPTIRDAVLAEARLLYAA